MKRLVKVGLIALAISATLIVFGVWLFLTAPGVLTSDSSALAVTREWARLAPLPESAREIDVVVRGSMLTREFVIEFDAPMSEVEEWLEQSPGTRKVPAAPWIDGSYRYEINPGGGAAFAEVIVSPDKTHVLIRTYWS